MNNTMKQRMAIIAHVFYPGIWPEISFAMKNLMDTCSNNASVFVTFPEGREDIAEVIRHEYPSANLQAVKNVGCDVWPFLWF